MSPAPTPRTSRGRTGIVAERVARRYLEALGWTILGANVLVGRGELDLVALDPDAPDTLVVIEVRGARTGLFGAPEESIDGRKLVRIWAGGHAILRSAWPPLEGVVRPRWVRVDVVSVGLHPALGTDAGGPQVRHLRGASLD